MQYALIIRESAEDFKRREDPAYKNGWIAYTQALVQAGVMTGGAGLTAPETATIVRLRGDDHHVQDGPFPDGKEQLGGFYLIDVPDLDAALEWAMRVPVSPQGSVEIRPRHWYEIPMSLDVGRATERVARQSYGKLIAFLAARSGDVPSAEDALSEALAAALNTWPERGIPDNPEAWLLVAARRNLYRAARHTKVKMAARDTIAMAFEEAEERMNADNPAFPDERLKLLFTCTHPAIDRSMHTPLMLQTVLGIDGKTIARAFIVSPETMSQRLVRAKAKIREAHIPFSVPDRSMLPGRLVGVLSAIYAAYGLGWDGLDGEDGKRGSLADEAIWLGRALLATLPEEPEAAGLLSLMLYCEARRSARRDGDGRYVPLDEQDTTRWNAIMIAEADGLLRQAGAFDRFGPFQCQAAIQSVHAERRRSGITDWTALATLYDALVLMTPTAGARVSQAAVIGRAKGAIAGLHHLDRIAERDVASYQPYWAVRAHLLAEAEDADGAVTAYRTAIGLSDSSAIREFLSERLAALEEQRS